MCSPPYCRIWSNKNPDRLITTKVSRWCARAVGVAVVPGCLQAATRDLLGHVGLGGHHLTDHRSRVHAGSPPSSAHPSRVQKPLSQEPAAELPARGLVRSRPAGLQESEREGPVSTRPVASVYPENASRSSAAGKRTGANSGLAQRPPGSYIGNTSSIVYAILSRACCVRSSRVCCRSGGPRSDSSLEDRAPPSDTPLRT